MLGWIPRHNNLRTIICSAYGWEKRSKALTIVPTTAIPVIVATAMPANVIQMEVPVANEQQLVMAVG
jgi:hypothetical protein